ncbi:MAG: hypothetical protein NZT92_15790 [Abditibacteriales bacterium]|nr:hypothetical protein [Abditibacteriales bacterium]MDW8364212.1 hypothetical protein [Abditibacteriales bacterium]
MPAPTTFLLDKGIVRGAFEATVRLVAGRPPTDDQLQAISVYQALLTAGRRVGVTPEAVHAARRRDERIAAVLLDPLVTLTPGRYLRRWARRLREHGITREDALVIAYASFGLNTASRTLGAAAVVTLDRGLIKQYREQEAVLSVRFHRMVSHLKPPYQQAVLPRLLSPSETLALLSEA